MAERGEGVVRAPVRALTPPPEGSGAAQDSAGTRLDVGPTFRLLLLVCEAGAVGELGVGWFCCYVLNLPESLCGKRSEQGE